MRHTFDIPANMPVKKIINVQAKTSLLMQTGFSLIELMIASMLGIFIIGGVLGIHLSNKQAFLLQESSSYTQKNARFFLNTLNKKISTAGYSGFFPSLVNPSVDDTLNLAATNSILWDIKKTIYGYNNYSGSSLLGITNIVSGSDVLMLKTMTNISQITAQDSVAHTLTFGSGGAFNEADILIATDIDSAAIFQVGTVTSATNETTISLFSGSSPAPGNTAMPVTTSFGNGNASEVGKLETVMYMLRQENGRKGLYSAVLTTSIDGSPALSTPIEIISNVEALQFVYGVDTNADDRVDKYSDAASVSSNSEWDKLKSIGIALVVSSENNNVAASNNSYSFDATTFSFTRSNSSGDKKYRRSYISYVTLKNI